MLTLYSILVSDSCISYIFLGVKTLENENNLMDSLNYFSVVMAVLVQVLIRLRVGLYFVAVYNPFIKLNSVILVKYIN